MAKFGLSMMLFWGVLAFTLEEVIVLAGSWIFRLSMEVMNTKM